MNRKTKFWLVFWFAFIVVLAFGMGLGATYRYMFGSSEVDFSSPRPAVVQTGNGDLDIVVLRRLSYGCDGSGNKKFFEDVFNCVRMDGSEGIVIREQVVEFGERVSEKISQKKGEGE